MQTFGVLESLRERSRLLRFGFSIHKQFDFPRFAFLDDRDFDEVIAESDIHERSRVIQFGGSVDGVEIFAMRPVELAAARFLEKLR